MPLAPNKPYCYGPDGMREELPVSPVLTPEVNLQELVQGGANTHELRLGNYLRLGG